MQTAIKGIIVSEIGGIWEKHIFKSAFFVLIFGLSSAARTDVVPRLLKLCSSPQ